ncbi:hypothetical protein MKUB_34250 [Mycobacterium kubicae]|uniref:Uncharacterized protein n=1 Tax=Mycobacterium kubicae TaxID=120959 RepID=A0ABQ1BQF0_9MYCO|nr:hypothetical protein MKUB_34250 [Mycobacterium kubicae]
MSLRVMQSAPLSGARPETEAGTPTERPAGRNEWVVHECLLEFSEESAECDALGCVTYASRYIANYRFAMWTSGAGSVIAGLHRPAAG